MKKKMLLVLPSHYQRDGSLITVKKASLNLNLSLPTLAGLTPADRFEMRILNDYVHPVDPDTEADLVAITTLTTTAQRAYDLADQFRARGKTVVLGGYHVWAFPEEAAHHADAIAVGEAEDIWPQIADDYLAGRLRDRYIAPGPAELAGRPAPRYDLVNIKDYKVEVYPVESSRGCPFHCDYCAVTAFHGGRHRLRPLAEVLRNIQATGSRYIAFTDDNIVADKDYARELFKALIPLKIRWMAQSTMLLADDTDLIRLAAESGLRFAWIGVESISPRALSEVHRKINQVQEFERRIAEFNANGILVGANIIFGFDQDTKETFRETYDFLIRNKVFPFLYILTPVPGTKVYQRMKEDGRLLTTDWSRYTGYETVYRPVNFTPEELDDLYFSTLADLFTFKNNVHRSAAKVRLRNLKEDFFIQLGAFVVGSQVGYAARHRIPDYW
ncbi:MAG: B12-binding domain-containing radical SAM protein [Myxococcales bacterium]|nr:B12-binding domain-containing radical SAM protein [Myxococcales bacterium]